MDEHTLEWIAFDQIGARFPSSGECGWN